MLYWSTVRQSGEFRIAFLFWNNLPSLIKSISDKCSFKSTTKKHLATNARVIHESADIA